MACSSCWLRTLLITSFFASKNSVASENCLDEVAYAKSHQKPSLLIFLEEDVTLPGGTEMQTARFQRMFLSRQPSLDAFVQNLQGASILDGCVGDATAPAVKPPQKIKKPVNKTAFAVIGVAALLVAVAVILLLVLKQPAAPAGGETVTTTTTAPPVVTLSDKLADNTFRLDGVVYQLPTTYAALTAGGWTIADYDVTTDTLIAGQSELLTRLAKNGRYLYVDMYNPSGNATKIADAAVIGIDATNTGDLFCVAGELKPTSSADAVIAKHGTPDDRNDTANYVDLIYGSNAGDSYLARFTFYSDDPANSRIRIRCALPASEQTETKNERPAYLAQYKAPAALGSDPTVPHFSLGGIVYTMPLPVQTFLDNGWTIDAGASAVAAGAETTLSLRKGEEKIRLSIVNNSLYQTTAAGCLAIKLSADAAEAPSIALPGGITAGATAATLRSTLSSAFDEESYSSFIAFSYSNYKGDNNLSISLYVDTDTGTLGDIFIENGVESLFP